MKAPSISGYVPIGLIGDFALYAKTSNHYVNALLRFMGEENEFRRSSFGLSIDARSRQWVSNSDYAMAVSVLSMRFLERVRTTALSAYDRFELVTDEEDSEAVAFV